MSAYILHLLQCCPMIKFSVDISSSADDKLNLTQNVKVVFHRIENIVGKEENAGYQHFLLFPQCFHKAFTSSASKVVIVWYRDNLRCIRTGSQLLMMANFTCYYLMPFAGHNINTFPNKPWFSRVCSTGHLKTLWEKEKLLVKSNFSFSYSVF